MSARILFVCSGNICRSPFAESYLRKVAAEIRLKGLIVSSAGSLRLRGRPASPLSVATAANYGVDLRDYRSRPLGAGSLRLADQVLVMEREHVRHIEEHCPRELEKVRLLREYEFEDRSSAQRDIFDPIGLDEGSYRQCFALIARCVENLAFHLKHPE